MNYNINYSISALCFLTLYYIFLKVQYSQDSKSGKHFRIMVLGTFCADFLDIVTAITISYADQVPLQLNYVLNLAYYEALLVCVFLLPEYLRFIIDPREGERCLGDKINVVILSVFSLVIWSDLFNGKIMYFDENLTYTHGPWYELVYIVPLYFLLYACVRMIMQRENFSRRAFIAVLIFLTFTIAGTLLQMLVFTDVLLTFFLSSLAMFVVLFALETPDFIKLQVTMDKLEEARAKEEEKNRTIHELMKSASWVLYMDASGKNVINGEWSDEFMWMLGYNPQEVEDKEYTLWTDSLHPDDKEMATEAFMRGFAGQEKYDIRYRMANKDGEYRWYRGTGELKCDDKGKVISYQGIIQDVNDEVEKEQLSLEREQALKQLEQSQEALEKAVAIAENANAAKSRFLTNMSHDIRTPMNAIMGFTNLAKENIDNKEEVAEYLNKIDSSSSHLLSLINDILDMSRIESGKVSIETSSANIKNMVEELVEILSASAEEKGLTLRCDVSNVKDEVVMCDKLHLNRVLINCVGNSIKFTPEGGKVDIKLEQNDNEYTFTISDTGIGMEKSFIEHIFEPFERERTSTVSKTQGTGLGMSITKNLIDMMGAQIRIESEVGVGTTYYITCTLEICADIFKELDGDGDPRIPDVCVTKTISIEEMTEFLKGKKFLLVDDNHINRMVAKSLLASRGMIVDEADDGVRAVEIVRNAKAGDYDLIFMDIQMPEMNGYEAADKIRDMDAPLSGIPIVAMTADAFEEDRIRCFEHGMNEHVAKPFNIEELIAVLYDLLSQ